MKSETFQTVAVRRTLDGSRLTEIANHPAVRPHLGGEGVLDLAPIVSNPLNYALEIDGGGFICVQLEPGIYEVHSLFLPSARSGSVSAMRDGMHYMFTATDCIRLVTQVPDANKAAAALAKIGGFTELFRREDTPRGPTSYQALDIDRWHSPSIETDGEWFHDKLEEAKALSGSALPIHPEDPAHDHAVGLAVRMIRSGNLGKGVITYNRWARFAGYQPISIVSHTPRVIDVIDAVVELDDGDMRVLTCR